MAYNQYVQSKISSRLGSFERYCKEQKIEVLKGDLKFIDENLNRFRPSEFKPILRRYLDEWLLGVAEAAKDSIKAQSLGRRRANLWLLGLTKLSSG